MNFAPPGRVPVFLSSRSAVLFIGCQLVDSFRDLIRGVLRVRKERAVPRRSSKPAIGACLIKDDLRMTVQAGLGDELWQWLLEQGWRELTYRPDRRHYREIPASWVTRLIDALPDQRAQLMAGAVTRARGRPKAGDPTALPSYVLRE